MKFIGGWPLVISTGEISNPIMISLRTIVSINPIHHKVSSENKDRAMAEAGCYFNKGTKYINFPYPIGTVSFRLRYEYVLIFVFAAGFCLGTSFLKKKKEVWNWLPKEIRRSEADTVILSG